MTSCSSPTAISITWVTPSRSPAVTGRLGGERDCPTLRDANGALFGLSGDLRDFGPGDRVRVIGFEEGRIRCGGRGIEVQEITGR